VATLGVLTVRRLVMLVLLIFLSSILIGSRFYPLIARVEVIGNSHYSPEEIMMLANVTPGDPFLWVTQGRLARLRADPWILGIRVIRHWPDTIAITVSERTPAVSDGVQSYALDGTVLTNVSAEVQASLIQLSGWGPPRRDEAFDLIRQLNDYGVQMVDYSPAGFTIQLDTVRLFTPNLELLQANWSGFLSQQGTRVSVYPWGVSAAHD
jgi:cell division protein FtsQ